MHEIPKQPILVFGATGKQGGSVVRALAKAQWSVRAFVRDPSAPKSLELRDLGIEIIQGTFADERSIRCAMKDAYGVFSVQPGASGDRGNDEEELRCGIVTADLASDCGIALLVYSSGASVGEKLTGVARFDNKPLIEAHIRSLPIPATIVRPMIFMEMLTRPGFGPDERRFTFFLRPDQPMQLVAVQDIGKFVAAIFADKIQFVGRTLKIASDTVTGNGLAASFSEVLGCSIAYARFSDEVLAANPDLKQISESLEDGPLSDHVDLDVMRGINPEILSFRSWLLATQRN